MTISELQTLVLLLAPAMFMSVLILWTLLLEVNYGKTKTHRTIDCF